MAEPLPVIGHEATLARLEDAHAAGRLGHALLLAGPHGVGKTTLALRLATTLLDGATWPGGIAAHPDLWLDDSDEENLSIQRIRAGGSEGPTLQDAMSLRTWAGGMRVAIVARADRLTEQAADALLKTLEEPPPRTVIILCAANADALPETIVSRAQLTSVGSVPTPSIAAWLEARGVASALARLAAALAGGRPGRALRLATEPGALATEMEALHAFLAVAGAGTDGALRAAETLTPGAGAEGRERAMVLLAVWASFVRDAACTAEGSGELRLWTDYQEALERWAEHLGPARLTDILGLLLRATTDISRYALPRLTFETLFLDIFASPDAPPAVDVPATPAALAEAPAGAPPRSVSARKPAGRGGSRRGR